ncbi:MAG: TRAP transporter small permease [Hespellia sp.]|nr:TRAP transporter small permease [Hespellia sp.]
MKKIKWINENFEEAMMIFFLIIMTLVMGFQICMRYIFNASMSWTEELTRYLFVWSGFLSISFAVERSIAIRLEQLTEKMKPKAKSIVFFIDYAIEFLFFLYLIPTAGRSLVIVFASGQVSTAMQMPMWILQLAPLVGFLLAEIRLIQKMFLEIRKIKEDTSCR